MTISAFTSSSNTNDTRADLADNQQFGDGPAGSQALANGTELAKTDDTVIDLAEDAPSLRRLLDDLSLQRDAIDNELAEIVDRLAKEHGVGLTSPPLVDAEGFPLADVDVYAVRHLRSRAHELRNDYSALTGRIEPLLHRLHSLISASGTDNSVAGIDQLSLTSTARQAASTEPALAVVGQVDSGSPAAAAGLQPGDIVLRVGPLSGAAPRPPLTAIAEHLRERLGRPVIFALLGSSDRRRRHAVVTPGSQWPGSRGGILGCRLLEPQAAQRDG